MDEVIRLKSRFVSSRPGDGVGAGAHTGSDEAASRLVEGVLRRKSFYFQQRSGKLDMRAIGRVDVDNVVKEVDIDTLQAHLENITFANVSEDDLRLYSDQCFLNLFRLSQLLLEYLLSVQDTLATSLEALALKYSTIRKALDRGRAELHIASEQDRALKREVRQKRATIARYEQLLALPLPSSGAGRQAPGSTGGGGGKLHSCLTCGKMFTTAEFLQQHIVRKHAQQAGNNTSKYKSDEGAEEKTAAYPSQLRLFVQTSTGQYLDMKVQGEATVAQLRGYINSTAGFAAAGPSKRLLFRGVHLHDDQTLRECDISTGSQLVLIHTEPTEADQGESSVRERPAERGDDDTKATDESVASKQMATLIELMRHQMEWSMRSESGRREQDLGCAEALETRMRGIEASLPRRLEEFMEESVGGLQTSLRKALDDMEELHVKRSNAGAIQDDEDETRRKEEQEKLRLGALSEDMGRVCKQNADLLAEVARLKNAAANIGSQENVKRTPDGHEVKKDGDVGAENPSRQQVLVPVTDNVAPQTWNTSTWTLNFPAEGPRQAVVVEVPKGATCETLCGVIAAQLDVADARVVLRDHSGEMIPLVTTSSELHDLHQGGLLRLDVLQGHVLSDHVVDGLVDFYEQHVPVKARGSAAVSRSMAEIDLAAKRHATAGRKGQGVGEGGGERDGVGDGVEDVTDQAEKQVEAIREQLSATLTGGFSPDKRAGGFSQGLSISQSSPGLGLVATDVAKASGGIDHDDIFGDGDGHAEGSQTHVPLAELERAVLERQRTRPAGIERQMEHVSKTMETQLNLLLEEAEEELQQLEQDSLGSETYSSTDLSENPGVPTPAGARKQSRPVTFRGSGGEAEADVDVGENHSKRGSRGRAEPQQQGGSGGGGGNSRVGGSASARSAGGKQLLEDEDIPKSDWGRTLDTAVSIPEGPEERADQHEANAFLEEELERDMVQHNAGRGVSMSFEAGKGSVDMTALKRPADSGTGF